MIILLEEKPSKCLDTYRSSGFGDNLVSTKLANLTIISVRVTSTSYKEKRGNREESGDLTCVQLEPLNQGMCSLIGYLRLSNHIRATYKSLSLDSPPFAKD